MSGAPILTLMATASMLATSAPMVSMSATTGMTTTTTTWASLPLGSSIELWKLESLVF